MTAREEIAAAASTMDGLEISPFYRVVSKPGQGYVEWLRTEYPNELGGEDYWGVVVMLPTDLAAAQQWIEDNRYAARAALRPALIVTQTRPERLDLPDMPIIRALVIEGHRESEE